MPLPELHAHAGMECVTNAFRCRWRLRRRRRGYVWECRVERAMIYLIRFWGRSGIKEVSEEIDWRSSLLGGL